MTTSDELRMLAKEIPAKRLAEVADEIDFLTKRVKDLEKDKALLEALVDHKNEALDKVWQWCWNENATDIDADYIKRVLDMGSAMAAPTEQVKP